MLKTPGNNFAGFVLEHYETIDELSAQVHLFKHRLGCPLLAIKNEDSNKTFGIAFNTIPTDSTGVAHILEHSVLMGSQRYPVKDVFGEMNKGGLMTFLNAMTGADITYYPFATRNLKEYFNLMDVYCDVVFNPLLEHATFEQEGWHYHKEAPDAPLQYQGVVFNEMKGAFSDPIRLIFHHIFGGLMPGSTYAHESGGDPKHIPDLTYEAFCAFHRTHYHPSNSIIVLYGDAPLEDELSFIDDRFLSHFQEAGGRSELDMGTLAGAPHTIRDRYGVEAGDTDDRSYLAVGTHVGTVAERERNASFQVIANILYNSDASPLKNKIVSSGICKDFGGLYLASSCFNTVMITYLVGSSADHEAAFRNVYREALEQMVADGLDKELVLSELNKYEFNVREDASKAQRGLDLMGKALAAFKYDTDPFEALKTEDLLRTIREKALEGGYFEDLIKESLLDNPATVTVILEPDPAKLRETAEQEQQQLDTFAAGLSAAEEQELIVRTRELLERQQTPNSPEKLALLPQLDREDLPASIDFHTVTRETWWDREILLSDLPTNRITYLDVGLDLSTLPHRYLPLLDLFGAIVTEIGTERLSYRQFAKEVATCTGGLTHSINTYTKYGSPDTVRCLLWLNLKALPEYFARAVDLLAELFSSVSFADRTRIREIVRREFAWSEHAAQSEGYNLPSTRVFSHLSLAGRYQEEINGITAYRTLKDLATRYEENESEFLHDLREMADILFNRHNTILSVTGETEEIRQFNRIGKRLPDALSDRRFDPEPIPQPPRYPRHEAFITAAEVVFAVQGGTLLTVPERYHGSFEVLKTYLSRDYLWNTVRQMGGAYGCFIQFSHITGNLALISYRDPQVRKTFEAYRRLPQVIDAIDMSPQAFEQIVIGTYGAFDPLQSAAARGTTARNEYLSGIDKEQKQQRLREITDTTQDDLRSWGEPFATMLETGHRAIIGNRAKIESDRDLFDTVAEL